jgi:hypothetical protein
MGTEHPYELRKATVWCSAAVIMGSHFFEDGQAVTFLSYGYTHMIETYATSMNLLGHEYV